MLAFQVHLLQFHLLCSEAVTKQESVKWFPQQQLASTERTHQ